MTGSATFTIATALGATLFLGACGPGITSKSDELASYDEASSEEVDHAERVEGAESESGEASDEAVATAAGATVDTFSLTPGGPSSSYRGGGGGGYETFGYASANEPEFDEDAARQDARREVYRRGYRGWCSSDCSGHEAGFEWAHENRLNLPQPTYDSQSFDEGQQEYVKAVDRRVEEKRQEFEDEVASSDHPY